MARHKITPPIEFGARVTAKIARLLPGAKRVKTIVAEGRAYLDDRNSLAGCRTFRGQQWIETRGEEGGYVIPWQALILEE